MAWISFLVGLISVSLAVVSGYCQSDLAVDLGYAHYQGFHNNTSSLNIWQGIRYAAPPTGKLRFQAPQPPLQESGIQKATQVPPQCPQGNLTDFEDCLFLSVFAPPNAKNLPVFLWIHGGGFFGGSIAQYDPQFLMSFGHGSFISVVIQYRLGAYGWLAGPEIKKRESAGGGSVLLHSIAGRGSFGTSLFRQVWAASPYTPLQFDYDDEFPTNGYVKFLKLTDCYHVSDPFGCLVGLDQDTFTNASSTLQSNNIGVDYSYSAVTDHEYIQTLPSEQLTQGPVNGASILSGNNGNEGPLFVNSSITTAAEFDQYISELFSSMDNNTLAKLKRYYPESLDVGYGTGVYPALHGQDIGLHFIDQPGSPSYLTPTAMVNAFIPMMVAYITTGNPSTPEVPFPRFSSENPSMVNFNSTGKTTLTANVPIYPAGSEIGVMQKNAMNNITITDAYEFASGRGQHCDFLRSYGRYIPE
ncbi:hypothetical protein B7463_g8994, partial [Scytalidium lignicola]